MAPPKFSMSLNVPIEAEGRNVTIEWSDEGREGQLLYPDAARRQRDAVLVMAGPHRVRPASQSTTAIAIVGIDPESDPVASGFVKSLARPGENVTGVWLDLPELAGKQIQHHAETTERRHDLAIAFGPTALGTSDQRSQ